MGGHERKSMEIRAKPATAILAVTARGSDIFYFFPSPAFFNSAHAMRCVLGFRHLFVDIKDGVFYVTVFSFG